MAEILLFHHAQALTAGVQAFAARLRAAGHEVHAPDLYDGRTFATLEEGYPGDRHLFADESLPGYDADAARAAEARVLELLG